MTRWCFFQNLLGWIWALPVTLFALFPIAGGVAWVGFEAEDWSIHLRARDGWPLQRIFKWWNIGGLTIGHVVIYATLGLAFSPRLVQHERVHVRQCAKFGIFHPIMYALMSLFAWLYGQDYYSGVEAEEQARYLTGQEEQPNSIKPHGGIRGLKS